MKKLLLLISIVIVSLNSFSQSTVYTQQDTLKFIPKLNAQIQVSLQGDLYGLHGFAMPLTAPTWSAPDGSFTWNNHTLYVHDTTWKVFSSGSGGSSISLTSFSATSPILYNNTTGVFSSLQSNTSQNGYLSSTDWNTFNGKQSALSGTGYAKWSGSTPSYQTPTQVTADLNVFTSLLKGLVPASSGGTTTFLRADGTFALPVYTDTTSLSTRINTKLNGSIINEIAAMGDSQTGAGRYESTLSTLLSNNFNIINFGIGGNQTPAMLARFGLVTNAVPQYVIILGGVNDLTANASAATIESNLQAMYTAAHNAGSKVVAITILPFGTSTSWSSARQTVQDAVNAWITSIATSVDYVIDGYTALGQSGSPNNLNPIYDSGDGLHPNNAGYDVLANTINSGATFTVSTSTPTLRLAHIDTLNQNVSTSASPWWIGVNTNILKVYSVHDASIPMPSMTTTQKNAISSPVEGNQVWDNTLHLPSFYNGTSWFTPLTVSNFTSPDFTTSATIGGIAIPTISSANTLTNKAITKRVTSVTSSATPAPSASTDDMYKLTALAANATIGSPGTGTAGQEMIIRIKDDGTQRTLTWNAIFRASTDLPLPATTTVGKTIYMKVIYNADDTKWDLIGYIIL